ncbi:MAG: UDP-N-acetylmuramoyl-L-alanyl-D-glutamate--2,6-diaminopimelate ligase, partial [Candidatus Zixiibacteriota bacterium]
MKLEELIKPLADARLKGGGDIDICGIEYDSRRIKSGMLFAAVKGYKMDGNRFIPQAIENGAAAVLTEEKAGLAVPVVIVPDLRKAMADIAAHFYGYPGKKLKVVGVTGTNGKSTSVYLIKMILETAGEKTGMVNSLVYDTGAERYKAERTTPDSVDLQRLLSEMYDANCTSGVIEVSSHALVLHRVDNIDFRVGLYTSFSRDHLDFHKTMDEYLEAKKLFLNKLEGDANAAVINMDVREFAGFVPDVRCRLVTYSAEGRKADVGIKNAGLYPDQSEFVLTTYEGEREVRISLPGRYNLSNAVGSAAAGVALGIDLDHIAQGLEAAQAVPGRFQPINMGQPFLVVIDYAHTPDAVERLCLSAREITKGKLIILFGCGGDRDRGKRPLMGRAASVHSDYAVITSDNPRTEDPRKIIEDIIPGMANNNYVV